MVTAADIPAALVGTPPAWWPKDEAAALAWGPFAVEPAAGSVRIAALLRATGDDEVGYSDGDREHRVRVLGDPVRRGNVLAFRGPDGGIVFRPLRESDREHVVVDVLPGDSLADAVRRSFGWDLPGFG